MHLKGAREEKKGLTVFGKRGAHSEPHFKDVEL